MSLPKEWIEEGLDLVKDVRIFNIPPVAMLLDEKLATIGQLAKMLDNEQKQHARDMKFMSDLAKARRGEPIT